MSTTLETGAHLGRYRIERRLGRGTTGAVYLAHDTSLDVQVALKVLNPTPVDEEIEAVARFLRELVLTRRITHPGVCRTFDLHEEGETRFITMEYVPGETLAAVLERDGQLPLGQAVRMGRALCRGLAAAHREQIVHRDLKPANIIITPENKPVILDFGFAKAPGANLTRPGTTPGTPAYMAPEMIMGEVATAASDIYAVGVILYQAVTGRKPFVASTVGELASLHGSQKPVPPSHYQPEATAELDAVIARAIAVKPDERFGSAAELDEALSSVGLEDVVTDPSSRSPWHRDIEKTVVEAQVALDDSGVIRKQMRPTTVLFSDIVGITSYFDKHGDIAGRRRLERHFRLLTPVIGDHSGVIVKTIGDAIMSVFKRAEQAVRAAVEMQRRLASHNDGLDERQDHIQIRIGCHSGLAIVEARDVFGDTVNVAARICGQAAGGEILMSHQCRELIDNEPAPIQFSREVWLRGKQEPVRLFSAGWDEALPDPFSGATELDMDPVSIERARAAVAGEKAKAKSSPPARRPVTVGVGLGLAAAVAVAFAVVVVSGRAVDPGASPPDASEGAVVVPSIAPLAQAEPEAPPPPVEPDAAPEPEVEPEVEPDAAPEPEVEPEDLAVPELEALKVPSGDKRSRAAERAAASKKLRALEQAMKSRGIIAGDDRGVDDARRRAEDLIKRGSYGSASRLAVRGAELATGVPIDETFIAAKLRRFNARYDRANPKRRKELESLVDRLMKAYVSRDFGLTNRLLNRAFARLS